MMAEASVPRAEQKEVGPNHFGYCMHEIVELLSGNEEFLSPISSQTHELSATCAKDKIEDIHDECGRACKNPAASNSLFCNGIGHGLPDFQRERLKASLKESVLSLNQEVDEMLGPVMAMCKIKSHLRGKEGLPKISSASGGDLSQPSFKKQKQSSSPTVMGAKMPMEAGGYEGMGDDSRVLLETGGLQVEEMVKKYSDELFAKVDDDLQVLLENGGLHVEEMVKKYSDELFAKVDDDLRVLLENGGLQVEEMVKKYSDELFAKLGLMEQQLEELLDIVMSKSRSMTITEKQELHKLIQELPPKKLDRIVEIVHRKRPPECHPCNEVYIDLEKEDNQTLWRMYYHVEAVASAKKLAS